MGGLQEDEDAERDADHGDQDGARIGDGNAA
jgi:hypothetical protein